MTKIKDLTGQRFGKIVAVRPTDERKNGHTVWECLCDCGNTAYVTNVKLTTGKTKSCGCSRRNELTGRRFGKLVAVRPTERQIERSTIWECLCDCGATTYVSACNLTSRITKSCGCIKRKDITGQRFGKLVAVRPTGEKRMNNFVWECLCDCGNTTFVRISDLTTGNTKSCGCLYREYHHSRSNILPGQRFGKLTVVRRTEQKRYDAPLWECVCDCGTTTYATAGGLNAGYWKSCGCTARKAKDLTGQRFGKLVAVRPTDERSGTHIVWECLCDCGATTYVSSVQLTTGKTKSCGCLRRKSLQSVSPSNNSLEKVAVENSDTEW